MVEEEEKPKEKRFTKDFADKYSKTSGDESTPEAAILEKQRKLLDKDPKNEKVWFARGLLLMDMGRNDEALDCMDHVVAINPAHPGVWNARAEVLRRLGRDEEAAESLRKALERIGPQVDGRFKERMERSESVEQLLREVGAEKPSAEEELTRPEEEEPTEEVSEVLEELETLGAADRTTEEMSPEEKEYRVKIQAWAAQGFDVSPLEHVLDEEPYKARTVFFQFEQNVAKITLLKETLDGIKIPGFKDEVDRLREAMKAPMNIWKVEADMGRLLPRVEAEGKELAREAARAAQEEAEQRAAVSRRGAAPRAAGPKVTKPPSLRPTEGRVNGLAAMGRVGAAATGRVNGLVNGLQTARRGMTNGLTNGNGFTNGLGSSRFKRETMYRRWKLGIIPAIAAILLIVTVFSAPMVPNVGPLGGIKIDGDASDWSGVPGYSQAQYVPVSNVNITDYRTQLKDNILSFLVQVKGTAMGDTANIDSFYAFIDGDGSKATGYRLHDLGADFMIEVSGTDGVVNISAFSVFNDDNPGGNDNWSAWSGVGSVIAAASNRNLEFQVDTGRVASPRVTFDPAKFVVDLVSDDNRGTTSTTVAKMGASYGALLVHQEGGPVTLNGGGVETLLTVTFEAVGSPVHINQLQFARSAKTFISDSPTNLDVLPSQPVQRNITVDTQSLGAGDFLTLEVTGVDADRPVTILGESARAYVGAVPAGWRVDGVFADWNPTFFNSDSNNVWPPNLDIRHYASNKTATDAFFYVDVGGSIMTGTAAVQMRQQSFPSQGAPSAGQPAMPKRGEDVFRVYIDSDSQDGQGNAIYGLPGADYMVEIKGINGKIANTAYYRWSGGRWLPQAGAPTAENDLRRMEVGLSLSGITVNSMQVAFESSSWRNVIDSTDISSVRSRTRSADETTYETLYGVSFPNEMSAGTSIRYTAGLNFLEWRLPGEILHIDGQDVKTLSTLSSSTLLAGEDRAEYQGAYPAMNTDVIYMVDETALKELFVVGKPIDSLVPSSGGVVRFTFPMRVDPALMTYVDGDGPREKVTTSKTISFTHDTEESFSIPSAFAWDTSGARTAIPYTWETNGPTLSIDVPVDFLLTAFYPVYIDPWVNYTVKNTGGPLYGSNEQFGYSVAIGDFNGDGYADLLTGAPGNTKNYTTGGAAYIYLGPLTSNKTTPNVNIPANAATNRTGWAVAACKCNADNIWDAVVTRYRPDVLLHQTTIYYGRSSWPLWVTAANVTIKNLGSGTPKFGYSVAAGNVDGAFYDDIIIGAPGNTNSLGANDGAAFVFLSPFSASVTSANFTLLPQSNATGQFGFTMATGLIDSDSKYDVVVGEPSVGALQQGRVDFFKGSSLSSGSGNRMPNAYLNGLLNSEKFGSSVAVGKLDSDGYEDVAIGAPANGISPATNGKVYLYLATSNGITTGQTPSREVLNQSSNEQFGTSVLIGPMLGPSAYNLAVGAQFAAAGGSNRGAVYMFATPLSSNTPTKTQTGDFNGDRFGFSLAGGTFANDDFYRLAVGNPNWVAGGSVGRVVIMYVPEFGDVAVVAVAIMGLGLIFSRRRRRLQR
jgi:tetratricopeptide (TPR) repeat protein